MFFKRVLAPLGFLLLAISLIWVWQYNDYRADARRETQAEKRLQEAICAVVEGSLHRMCKRSSPNAQTLEETLADMRERVGASFIGVLHADGELFVSTGSKDISGDPAAVLCCEKLFSLPDHLIKVDLRVLDPGTDGCSSGGHCGLPADLNQIRMEYPAARLNGRLARLKAKFAMVSGAITVALCCLFLFYMGFLRAADLRTKLGTAAERVRSLEFLSRLGAGLAHETKNPLGSIRGFGQLMLRRDLPEEDVRDAAEKIVDESDRIVARLDEFLLLSRPATPRMERFNVKEMLTDLAGLMRLEIAEKNGDLVIGGVAATVQADREQIRRLFMNLLVNAAEVLGPKGRITVTVETTESGTTVVVDDNGPGVPAEIRETLFEPYVSGRPGGTGLGLAIAARIALEHGWKIRYEPGVEGGTRMIVEVIAA